MTLHDLLWWYNYILIILMPLAKLSHIRFRSRTNCVQQTWFFSHRSVLFANYFQISCSSTFGNVVRRRTLNMQKLRKLPDYDIGRFPDFLSYAVRGPLQLRYTFLEVLLFGRINRHPLQFDPDQPSIYQPQWVSPLWLPTLGRPCLPQHSLGHLL